MNPAVPPIIAVVALLYQGALVIGYTFAALRAGAKG